MPKLRSVRLGGAVVEDDWIWVSLLDGALPPGELGDGTDPTPSQGNCSVFARACKPKGPLIQVMLPLVKAVQLSNFRQTRQTTGGLLKAIAVFRVVPLILTAVTHDVRDHVVERLEAERETTTGRLRIAHTRSGRYTRNNAEEKREQQGCAPKHGAPTDDDSKPRTFLHRRGRTSGVRKGPIQPGICRRELHEKGTSRLDAPSMVG